MLNKKKAFALSSIQTLDDVEYLESTYDSTKTLCQYINTGKKVNFDKDNIITGTFEITGNNRAVLIGGYEAYVPTVSLEVTADRKLRMYFNWVSSSQGVLDITTTETYPLNTPIVYKWSWESSNGTYTLDAATIDNSVTSHFSGTTTRTGTSTGTRTMCLFCDQYRSDGTTAAFNGTFMIYQTEWIEDGVTIGKYLPRVKNNVPYMYDEVSGTYLENKGGGYFGTGRKIREVEYIEFDGTQRFNTLFKPNTLSTTVKTTFELAGSDSLSRFPFGCRKAASQADSCAIYIAPATSANPNGYLRLDWAFQSSNPRYSLLSKTEKITLEITGNYSNINGEKNTSSNVTSYDQTAPFYIGTCYTTSTKVFQAAYKGKLYYSQLLNTTTRELYRDYIPAIDENGVAFLFDRVSHTVFLPETGTITEYGRRIIPVEYLQSDGNQYIDVDVIMEDTYSVEIAAKQIDETQSKSKYLFGYAAGSNRYMIAIAAASNNYIADLKSSSNRIISNISAYDGEFHIHKIKNNTYYIDGVSQGSVSPGTFTAGGTSYLFYANSVIVGTNTDISAWQIKANKIFDGNNVIIRDYIPAKDENAVGFMFDRVTHTIYDNAGTGKFKYGRLK